MRTQLRDQHVPLTSEESTGYILLGALTWASLASSPDPVRLSGPKLQRALASAWCSGNGKDAI
ncbi:hypothetical protein BDV06DRAFT_198863 [Aspergillus oleicola]